MEISIDKNGYERGNYSDLIHRQKAYRNTYLKNRDKYPLPFSMYIVHHIDKDKRNNKIANLQLVTKEEHDRIHGITKEKPLSEYEKTKIDEKSKEELDKIFEKYNNNDVKRDTIKSYSTDKTDWEDKPKLEKKDFLETSHILKKRDITKDITISFIIFIIIFVFIVKGTNEGWSSILKSEAMRFYGLMFAVLVIGFLIYIKIKE